MKPINGNVILRVDNGPKQSKGGITLSLSGQDGSARKAEVVAVSEGRWENGTYIETLLHSGVKVLIQPYGGTEVGIDGESLLVVDEADILAVL